MVKSNTYPEIYDYQNLITAYRNARKNKNNKHSVIRFSMNSEEELISIQNELIYGTYRPGEYHSITVYEPKKREIMVLPFRDRVVQHALYGIIHKQIERSMIDNSFACRDGKGTQRGVLKEQNYDRLLGPGHYILKCDIYHFFNSIDHTILKRILSKKIRDHKILWLCYKFIPRDSSGIPIGNLTSQLYANMYLDVMDHHIMDDLGISNYVRYMDDFVIHVKTRDDAVAIKRHLTKWIWDNLRLEFNAKTQVFPSKHGVNFLGYMVHYDHIKIRHCTVRRMKQKIKCFRRKRTNHIARVMDIRPALMSWLSLSKWGNCRTIENRIINILNGDDENGSSKMDT